MYIVSAFETVEKREVMDSSRVLSRLQGGSEVIEREEPGWAKASPEFCQQQPIAAYGNGQSRYASFSRCAAIVKRWPELQVGQHSMMAMMPTTSLSGYPTPGAARVLMQEVMSCNGQEPLRSSQVGNGEFSSSEDWRRLQWPSEAISALEPAQIRWRR